MLPTITKFLACSDCRGELGIGSLNQGGIEYGCGMLWVDMLSCFDVELKHGIWWANARSFCFDHRLIAI
eukprot:3541242-Amphidinium_carterae.1